jgi:hypothetical protein
MSSPGRRLELALPEPVGSGADRLPSQAAVLEYHPLVLWLDMAALSVLARQAAQH